MPVLYMERSSLEGLTEADIKKIINENEDSTKYQHLEGYYRGDHDILRVVKRDSTAPNNKIVNNMAKYITDTAVGYFIGKPVIYSSQDDAFLAALQDIFDYNDEQDENTEVAKTCSIDGDCFEMLYMDEDAQVRFVKVAPGNCIMIYETGYTTPMAALRFIYSRDKDDHPIKKVEFWTATDCWYFVSFNGGPLDLVDIRPHYWGDVPFIEYINNEERLGDFEGVVSIIDAYNRAQSNTANFFQYNDEAILKVLKMGAVTSQDIAEMKEKGAIILEDGGDIQWLIKEVADTPLENYKKRLREDMHLFSSVPNLNDENFGGNLSGVAVSYKLWGLEQVCAIKERTMITGISTCSLGATGPKTSWRAPRSSPPFPGSFPGNPGCRCCPRWIMCRMSCRSWRRKRKRTWGTLAATMPWLTPCSRPRPRNSPSSRPPSLLQEGDEA